MCERERGRGRERSAKKDCSKMQQISKLQSKEFVSYRREYSITHTVLVLVTHHAQAVLMAAGDFRRHDNNQKKKDFGCTLFCKLNHGAAQRSVLVLCALSSGTKQRALERSLLPLRMGSTGKAGWEHN